MILPIHVYGDAILREETQEVTEYTPELHRLIEDMFETMQGAAGIGLAAPQVGRRERLFVVDLTPMLDDLSEEEQAEIPPQPMVFVNPSITWESDDENEFEEGCLSIPDIRENVVRPSRVRISFQNRFLEPVELEVGSLLARVIQHEYDHLEGVLFIDHLSPLRRRLLRRRLREMAEGIVEADYPLAIST